MIGAAVVVAWALVLFCVILVNTADDPPGWLYVGLAVAALLLSGWLLALILNDLIPTALS